MQLHFRKFIINGQYVQSGEELFTVIPERNKMIGQMQLPSAGVGKVKVGQRVIVKLDIIPMRSMALSREQSPPMWLVSNKVVTNKAEVENYLVDVEFPKGLTTNYEKKLEFKFGRRAQPT